MENDTEMHDNKLGPKYCPQKPLNLEADVESAARVMVELEFFLYSISISIPLSSKFVLLDRVRTGRIGTETAINHVWW